MLNGEPTAACPTRPRRLPSRPFHDSADVNGGGPHGHRTRRRDINGGTMDGFLREAQVTPRACCRTADDAGVRGPRHART